MSGWQLEVYGGLWALALLLDFLGLAITALFLGELLSNPSHLAWVWVCKIGPLIGIPAILILLDAIWSLIAISFSSWVIYGPRVGIICTVVAVLVVVASVAIAYSFAKASGKREVLLRRYHRNFEIWIVYFLTYTTTLEEWSIFMGMTEIITKSSGCPDEWPNLVWLVPGVGLPNGKWGYIATNKCPCKSSDFTGF